MVNFLTTGAIAAEIEGLIINAKQEIVLITPYLSIHNMILQRLQYASLQGIPITFVYRKNATRGKAEEADLQKLKVIDSLALFAIDNLHAKCFMNESKMIITSMNLHQYSESHNREMGIVASKQSERQIYMQAYEEYISIKAAGEPMNDLAKKARVAKKPIAKDLKYAGKENLPKEGVCIRCKTTIGFNILAPYCFNCYSHWVHFGKPDCDEMYCHLCAKRERTSMKKPLCYDCWTENKSLLPHITHYHHYKM